MIISKNNENENIKKSKDNYKVIRTFNKNGSTFQEVMEKNSYYEIKWFR